MENKPKAGIDKTVYLKQLFLHGQTMPASPGHNFTHCIKFKLKQGREQASCNS